MNNLMNSFFGPLDKNSCVYFLLLTMFFFAMLVFSIVAEAIFLLKNFDKLNFRIFTSGLLLLFNAFIAYFVNRLLYTMCSKSLA